MASDEQAVEQGISADLSIVSYLHCAECLNIRPDGVSAREWARLEVGFTVLGLQVWCKRHEINVVHIDFQGQRHPANTDARSVD